MKQGFFFRNFDISASSTLHNSYKLWQNDIAVITAVSPHQVGGPSNRAGRWLVDGALEVKVEQSESGSELGFETLSPDRGWQDEANCLGVDPDLFFPERGASTREAKEVCRGCVVRGQCLEYALVNGEKFGIWGGLSERERRRLRRQRALSGRRSATA